jgi:DNA-directed RNA polymerase specialized sigma subunit
MKNKQPNELAARNAAIVEAWMNYGQEITMEELGRKHGISRSRVSRIIARAKHKLSKRIK